MAYALENVRVGLQLIQGTIAVADNMRASANVYLTQLSGALDGSDGNPTLAQIAAAMTASANSFATILNNVHTWGQNNQTLATNALAVFSVTLAAANSDLTALTTAAQNWAAADKTTVANAQTACNNLLAAVPAAPSVF